MERQAPAPPRPDAEEVEGGGAPGGLVERREALARQRGVALARVDTLVRTQQEVSRELNQGLAEMQRHGQTLDELEARAQDAGLMAALTRAFSRRRAVLQRRSAAEGLLARYETVSVSLRRAAAFSDELHLCALELQQQVDELHEELARSREQSAAAACRVLELKGQLDALEGRPAEPGDQAQRLRLADRLAFEERTESASLELVRARAELLEQELGPARALRDTIVHLHEEMARFVVKATSAVNSAGRRIQALGLAADAPLVVAELQESLADLGEAMDATEAYIEQTQKLLTQVLPDLSARISAQATSGAALLTDDLEAISRERARALADRALRDAAEAEVEGIVAAEVKKTL